MNPELSSEARESLRESFREHVAGRGRKRLELAIYAVLIIVVLILVWIVRLSIGEGKTADRVWAFTGLGLALILIAWILMCFAHVAECDQQYFAVEFAILHQSVPQILKALSDIKCYSRFKGALKEMHTVLKETATLHQNFSKQTEPQEGDELSKAYRGRGHGFLKHLNQPEAAITNFDIAIGYDTNEASLFLERGLAKMLLKDRSGASNDFDNADVAAEANDEKAEVWEKKALLALVQGEYDKAYAFAKKAELLAPHRSWNRIIMALSAKRSSNTGVLTWIKKLNLPLVDGAIPPKNGVKPEEWKIEIADWARTTSVAEKQYLERFIGPELKDMVAKEANIYW